MPRRDLPSRWFAPRAPLTTVLLDDVAAIEGGDASAMRRVLEQTGKLVGAHDVAAATRGIGVEAFTESLIDPVDDLCAIDDTDAEALVASLMQGSYSTADTARALNALERAFAQPALSDLIYWPRAEMTAAEIVRVARSTKGSALLPWLSPDCRTPAERCADTPSAASLSAARAMLLTLVEQEALELQFGEMAAATLAALIDAGAETEAIVARLLDDLEGVGEIYADDTTLHDAIERGKITRRY